MRTFDSKCRTLKATSLSKIILVYGLAHNFLQKLENMLHVLTQSDDYPSQTSAVVEWMSHTRYH
jgi:hypothetical protein